MILLIFIALIICMVISVVLSRIKRRSKNFREPREKRKRYTTSRAKSSMDVDEVVAPKDVRKKEPPAEDSSVSPSSSGSGTISFYDRDGPYYEFTNFSPHPIVFEGHEYPTAEHLFQAYKFMPRYPELAERIRNLPNPRAALKEATRLTRLRRADWYEVNVGIMDAILEAKFTQHSELHQMLLSTGDREIVEASPVDSFWGTGQDGEGRNELGKALMRLRDKLRERTDSESNHDGHDRDDVMMS